MRLYKVELTEDELGMITYALNEMANRRLEQSIDRKAPELKQEAQKHRNLASKLNRLP